MKNQSKIGMKYRKLSNPAKLAVINSRRRRGDIVKIANDLYYSESHICNVLTGKANNSRILNHAYNMVRGRMKNSVK